MNRLTFWTAWLMVVSLTMAVFGILMALLNQTRLFGGLMGEIENVFWPNGGATLGLLQFQEWVLGVWGATVAGFGLLAALVGGNAFGRRERWARDALAAALALWFLLDTALSLASRVWGRRRVQHGRACPVRFAAGLHLEPVPSWQGRRPLAGLPEACPPPGRRPPRDTRLG